MDPKTHELNPWNLEWVPYEGPIVRFVDSLIEFANKNGSTTGYVETSGDWKTMEYLIKGWMTMYPEYAEPFIEHMKEVRLASNVHGVAKEGEARIQLQLNIPEKLHQLIKIIFKQQPWDKNFVRKFSENFPIFKGADTKL